MTKDTITGVSTIVVDHDRNKQLFYYGAFTETGATQTIKSNRSDCRTDRNNRLHPANPMSETKQCNLFTNARLYTFL